MRMREKPKPKAYLLSKTVGFVPHPDLAGLWFRVHPCVVLCDCRRCGAKKGVPCRSSGKYVVSTHALRRDDCKSKQFTLQNHTVVSYMTPPSV